VPVGRAQVDRYAAALGKELELREAEYPRGEFTAETVYFGGGTPSLLAPRAVAGLLDRVRSVWGLEKTAEVTLECNPEDLDPSFARGCLEAGVNRLSIGCQSFSDSQLAALGRAHTAEQARRAVAAAREAGFARISADLILGGPGSGRTALLGSLETALGLGVTHLSIYGYHLEETCSAAGKKEFEPAGDSSYRSQYLAVCQRLGCAGWSHYEISNWAAGPAEACNHNLGYWTGKAYLGCGPSAHSFLPPELRSWNRNSLRGYLRVMEEGGGSIRQSERLGRRQVLTERLMLGLRLEQGVDRNLVESLIGDRAEDILTALFQRRLLRKSAGPGLRLSDQGYLVYDSVIELLSGGREFPLDKKMLSYQN
jgi:oxygen-independent coproporphyrinogen III oxidase